MTNIYPNKVHHNNGPLIRHRKQKAIAVKLLDFTKYRFSDGAAGNGIFNSLTSIKQLADSSCYSILVMYEYVRVCVCVCGQ